MENFTPIEATAGGALIGLAAALVLLLHGRICGISGIMGKLLAPPGGQTPWTLSFVIGLLLGGLLMFQLDPASMEMTLDRSPGALAGAGLLVGLGTAMGSGCTSGHGVCGLSRFSLRSLAATCTFMATGGIAAFVVRAVLGGSV
jgi:uncharacterized membrane protein YedE/YeeE